MTHHIKSLFKINALLISMLLCAVLFIATDSFTENSDSNFEKSVYSLTLASSETPTASAFISPASQFEHHQQSAKWLMAEIDDSLTSIVDSDSYLLAEAVPPEWFLLGSTSKYRLSGWKDASLIYKIKNALI